MSVTDDGVNDNKHSVGGGEDGGGGGGGGDGDGGGGGGVGVGLDAVAGRVEEIAFSCKNQQRIWLISFSQPRGKACSKVSDLSNSAFQKASLDQAEKSDCEMKDKK